MWMKVDISVTSRTEKCAMISAGTFLDSSTKARSCSSRPLACNGFTSQAGAATRARAQASRAPNRKREQPATTLKAAAGRNPSRLQGKPRSRPRRAHGGRQPIASYRPAGSPPWTWPGAAWRRMLANRTAGRQLVVEGSCALQDAATWCRFGAAL